MNQQSLDRSLGRPVRLRPGSARAPPHLNTGYMLAIHSKRYDLQSKMRRTDSSFDHLDVEPTTKVSFPLKKI